MKRCVPTFGPLVWLVVLFAPIALAQAPVPAFTFTGTLSGDQVTPPVETDGTGTAVAVLTGNQLVVTGSYRNLSAAATGASLRRGPRGERAFGVRLAADQAVIGNERFATLDVIGRTSGTFSGVFTLTDEQLEQLADGLFSVQVDAGPPTGELRGQLGSNRLYSAYREYLAALDDPGVVRDVTAEDMVGVWKSTSFGGGFQVYENGTWQEWDTVSEIGKPAAPGDTWTFEDGQFSVDWDAGQYGSQVELTLLYEDGRFRYLVIESGGRYAERVGTWREYARVDEQGDRIALRE